MGRTSSDIYKSSLKVDCLECGSKKGVPCNEKNVRRRPLTTEQAEAFLQIVEVAADVRFFDGYKGAKGICKLRVAHGRLLDNNPRVLRVQCPSCSAVEGEFCKSIKPFDGFTLPPMKPHPRRVQLVTGVAS